MRLGMGLRLSDILKAGAVVKSTLVDGLVSYWPLNEQSGTRNDVVGTNHLTDNNTVGYDTGVNGAAASFVAANSESLTVTNPLVGQVEFTISFWAKGFTGGRMFGVGGEAEAPGRFLLVDSAGTWYVFNTLGATVAVGSTPPTSNWGQMIATFTDADRKLRLYENGSLIGTSDALAGTPNFSTTGLLCFGGVGYGGGIAYNAGILFDEPAIWSRVLTADERTELFNAGDGFFYNATTEDFE